MGVLACDRKGCLNVMCDRVSHDYGYYICDDCFTELVNTGPTTDIDEFMDREKKVNLEEQSLARYNTIFVDRG